MYTFFKICPLITNPDTPEHYGSAYLSTPSLFKNRSWHAVAWLPIITSYPPFIIITKQDGSKSRFNRKNIPIRIQLGCDFKLTHLSPYNTPHYYSIFYTNIIFSFKNYYCLLFLAGYTYLNFFLTFLFNSFWLWSCSVRPSCMLLFSSLIIIIYLFLYVSLTDDTLPRRT